MKGLLSCTLLSFLINIPHSPASQAKLPHLYLGSNKPASPQHGIVFSFLFFSFLLNSQPFYFTCRFSFCSEKCQRAAMRPAHAHTSSTRTQTSSPSFIKIGMNSKKPSNASAWRPCFFFSFFMSFREGALHCLFCSSRQVRPFCLWKSQWERGGGAPSKTLAHHRSALPAPLAKQINPFLLPPNNYTP